MTTNSNTRQTYTRQNYTRESKIPATVIPVTVIPILAARHSYTRHSNTRRSNNTRHGLWCRYHTTASGVKRVALAAGGFCIVIHGVSVRAYRSYEALATVDVLELLTLRMVCTSSKIWDMTSFRTLPVIGLCEGGSYSGRGGRENAEKETPLVG